MPTGDRVDPYAVFRFTVEIGNLGTKVAGFSEISGVSNENDKIEYREGADDITVRKIAGLKKFTDITLKRGFTKDRNLWEWRKSVLDGKTIRYSGSIVLQDEAGVEALRWTFKEAWPSKYSAPAFNAKTNEAAIEELVLQVEDIQLDGSS